MDIGHTTTKACKKMYYYWIGGTIIKQNKLVRACPQFYGVGVASSRITLVRLPTDHGFAPKVKVVFLLAFLLLYYWYRVYT